MEIEKCGVHRAAGGICMYRSARLSAEMCWSAFESLVLEHVFLSAVYYLLLPYKFMDIIHTNSIQ